MASVATKPKVAIVHDWLIGGGAERVVYELHLMFPEAPIYTSYCNDEWRNKLDGKVVTGFLQNWPFSILRKYLPVLRILWFERLNLNNFDLVISSSGAEAKAIKVKKSSTHINYCHAPTHYYWSRYDDYMKYPGFPKGLNWLGRLGLKLLIGPLRRWDYRAAQRPDHLIANSSYTKAQVKKYYGRDSTVIHPPVEIKRFQVESQTSKVERIKKSFVIAGRQTPYKKLDLAVAVCTQLNLLLTVIGSGPDHRKLLKMAGPTITFVTNASDEEVAGYLASSEAFIFPGVDDFGIVAVEAMAAGTPVIAYKDGGALDYVIEGKTGMFFKEQTFESLGAVLQSFDPNRFNSAAIQKHAEQFSPEVFHQKMKQILAKSFA